MLKKILSKILLYVYIYFSFVNIALAHSSIKIVGSSTVYPFVTIAAEEFGRNSKYRSPTVETNGTGGGFKLFCQGISKNTPDIVNASRHIKNSEIQLCKKNNINDIMEVKIGYDGIVLANSINSLKFSLTSKQIFLALAHTIPSKGKLVNNYYKKWSDISKSLPGYKIEIYGPPPTSGTRDAFVELVMQKVCINMDEFKKSYPDIKKRKKICSLLREDGAFIDVGENDNIIVQKIINNKTALGIFGYSFLEQNSFIIQANLVDGVIPSFETIKDGSYPISRPLYVYVKTAHIGTTSGLKEFLKELTSYDSMGYLGYLAYKGLVPISEEELLKIQNIVENINI